MNVQRNSIFIALFVTVTLLAIIYLALPDLLSLLGADGAAPGGCAGAVGLALFALWKACRR